MSKRAASFEKRTGWSGNAAGGASPKRQPYHADRRDVGAGTLGAANSGPGATVGPARGPSQQPGQKVPCPYCPNAMLAEHLEKHIQKRHMRRPLPPRSQRPMVFLTERFNPECPYCQRKIPLVSMAKHQQREHPGQPLTASENPYG